MALPTASIKIKRNQPPKPLISLVPLVDVMLILLVFFMVTSTYLDLDIVPAIERTDSTAAAGTPTDAQPAAGGTMPAPLLIRLGSDGLPALHGQTMTFAHLQATIRARLIKAPLTAIVVLPSGAANMQALISVMDAATDAGATRLQVIQLEARP